MYIAKGNKSVNKDTPHRKVCVDHLLASIENAHDALKNFFGRSFGVHSRQDTWKGKKKDQKTQQKVIWRTDKKTLRPIDPKRCNDIIPSDISGQFLTLKMGLTFKRHFLIYLD